ncbi:hypothetical protein EXM98_04165 [Clostridium botulinum]|uniref:hypothetical protein n=1 Tax=Clostridium botulinum TaxID=1491 RepID=UPI0005F90E72|nr:hypothetical protein [Clostridium botulinum]MBY6877925.1 hypothetical protein [Clostridium botulinum]MBY6878482.1 hypothetical protein [Clostridium botulinum]NFC27853.1 hypothetical protein [Clostridium botulinum]NFC60432.1 hypothetical protein [Clostridium botulinum]NFC68440.1 hypothetical protein [Clostridium botulinum]
MSVSITIDGLEYTKSNHRLRYNPEFHENHGKPFTKDDLIYMCSMWDSMQKADIAMALGRTHGTILSKKYYLKKIGLFDYYKRLGKES